MLDFRFQVFYTVARRLSFTKASSELYISQPAVTKHIKELESQYKTTLFERSGNKKIVLTPSGVLLMRYVDRLLPIYRELEFDMSLLHNAHNGILRVGASSTVAQYVIPPILASFHKKFKDIHIQLSAGNTEEIERSLINKEIEVGIIEGLTRNPQIKYEKFLLDELVLVSSTINAEVRKDSIAPAELKTFPLVMREPGSGTLEVIAHALKPHDIKLSDLQIEMQLGTTESIKSYLLHSNCLAFLSVHSIIKELKANQFRIIDIKDLAMERTLHFIQFHGQQSPLAELFTRFTKNYKDN